MGIKDTSYNFARRFEKGLDQSQSSEEARKDWVRLREIRYGHLEPDVARMVLHEDLENAGRGRAISSAGQMLLFAEE